MPDLNLGGLFFIVLTLPALILTIFAYKIKKKQGQITTKSLIMITSIIIYVLYGIFSESKPHIWGAFNPWFDNGYSFVSYICLFFMAVIAGYFLSNIRVRFVIVITFIIVIGTEAFITPGVRIFYDNNPLLTNAIDIIQYDSHYAKLPDGRIIYVEKGMPRERQSEAIKAVLTPIEAGKIRITISTRKSRNSNSVGEDKFITQYIRNPFRESNMKLDYGVGVILPKNWEATGQMLRTSVSGYNLRINWIKQLLKRGANPNYTRDGKASPMYRTVYSRNLKILKLLFENGGDVNVSNPDGNTPLHIAVQLDVSNETAYKIIKFLVENGADLDSKNNQGKSPREIFISDFNKIHSGWRGYPISVKVKKLMDEY